MSDVTELAKKFHELRLKKDDLKDALSTLQKELDQVETSLVEDLQQSGMSRVDLDDIGSFSLATRSFYKVEDREKLFQFLQERDSTDLLSVNHNTLNGYVKSLKESEGDDFEVPGVTATSEVSIRMRKN